jgi:glycosyltransferase involved in cell wall biosynthesis
LKICFIISDINKAVYFEQTALQLKAKELDVSYILINSGNGALHQFLIKNGFVVHTLQTGNLLKSRKAILKCRQLLKEMSITHVHCHLAHANWIGLWAAKLSGISHRIYTRHSGEPLKLHWKERMIDKIQNRLATKIVSISQNIDDLLKKQGVPGRKRVLIHHGFDLNRFSNHDLEELKRLKQQYNPQGQKPVFGIIARWMEWKGVQYSIDAFRKILKHDPNALLCLFGASENADYSVEIKNKLNLVPAKNICIVPFENNVFDLYQLFDIYIHVPVNPSCEAFGQTYVEALAAGIPSVFTLSGVAQEFIVHEENALVVPFKDSNAIYEAMLRLLNDLSLRGKLSAEGFQSVSRMFSFEDYIRNLQKLYRS